MRVLIIGGTGLISTAITRQLVERGDQVTLFNRGQSEVRTPPVAKTIIGDRKNIAAFEAQMAAERTFDAVIDMICYSPQEAESDVRAFANRCGHFIFCSTVDVYTKPATRYPYTESEPLSGISQYAQKKVACEKTFMSAHERADLRVTIIRPAYTYGEGQPLLSYSGRDDMLIDRLRKHKPVIVQGDGQSLWVCCHCDDVARAFIGALGNTRTWGKAYHATGEEWMTWDQYYRTLASVADAPPPDLVHIPSDLLAQVAPQRGQRALENFQFSNIFDNTTARRDLGFRYTIVWKDGARRVIEWLESRERIANSDGETVDDAIVAAWRKVGKRMGIMEA